MQIEYSRLSGRKESGKLENDDLFNDAVKALKASEKMNDLKYTVTKNRVLIECADLGEEAQAFIKEFFVLADERRASAQ